MRVLVTGGAGFIGSTLPTELAKRNAQRDLAAADNLHRPGSDLTLDRLRDAGVSFLHADVRDADDLDRVTEIDGLIESSAEPSVLATASRNRRAAVRTNHLGAHHCLELTPRDGAADDQLADP